MTEPELREKIAKYITGCIMSVDQKEWHYDDWPDALSMAKGIFNIFLEAGWMDVDMVKGLIFEMQAKKCAQCKVTGSS